MTNEQAERLFDELRVICEQAEDLSFSTWPHPAGIAFQFCATSRPGLFEKAGRRYTQGVAIGFVELEDARFPADVLRVRLLEAASRVRDAARTP